MWVTNGWWLEIGAYDVLAGITRQILPIGNFCRGSLGYISLCAYWPGRNPAQYTHLTAHHDIPPALLKRVLGITQDPRHYSSGWDLFLKKGHPWVMTGTGDNYGVVGDDGSLLTVQFSSSYELTDRHLRPLTEQHFPAYMPEVFNEQSRFYRR